MTWSYNFGPRLNHHKSRRIKWPIKLNDVYRRHFLSLILWSTHMCFHIFRVIILVKCLQYYKNNSEKK
jgi:hypothetical protein